MRGDEKAIPQEDAEYHLEMLSTLAEDVFLRYAYLTLWRIRGWGYEGFTGDYFLWPYAGELSEISFIEELVWVLHETGHEKFVDAYESHLRQACRPVFELLSNAEKEVLIFAVSNDLEREISFFQKRELVEERLLKTIMGIVRYSDMQGIRESWASYFLAVEPLPDNEDT